MPIITGNDFSPRLQQHILEQIMRDVSSRWLSSIKSSCVHLFLVTCTHPSPTLLGTKCALMHCINSCVSGASSSPRITTCSRRWNSRMKERHQTRPLYLAIVNINHVLKFVKTVQAEHSNQFALESFLMSVAFLTPSKISGYLSIIQS